MAGRHSRGSGAGLIEAMSAYSEQREFEAAQVASASWDRQARRSRMLSWRPILLAGLIWCRTEVPAEIVGLPRELMRQGVPALILGGAIVSLFAFLMGSRRFRLPDVQWSLLVIAIMFVVSFISANYIYPKPLNDWIFSFYSALPLLLVYPLILLRYTEKDVFNAIFLSAIIGCLLLIINDIRPLQFLEFKLLASHFYDESTRISLNPYMTQIFTIFVFAILLGKLPADRFLFLLGLFGVLIFVQARLIELRLILYGTAFSCLITKVLILLFIGIVPAIILAEPYIRQLFDDRLLIEDEANILIRIETFHYFWDRFLETSGIGFGIMSATGETNNVLRPQWGVYGWYGYNITDLGLYSAFLQFGVVGGLVTFYLTFKMIYVGYRGFRVMPEPDRWRPAVFATFLLASLFTPIPVNLITVTSKTLHGGLLLFLLTQYSSIVVRERSRQRGLTSPPPGP
jgi:hypothetical protein